MVLRCNHTIIYEGQEERQGPVLQLLKVSGMNSVYNMFTLTLDFHITSSLLIPGPRKKTKQNTDLKRASLEILDVNVGFLFADGYEDTCPKGFILDTASYCAGMLQLSFLCLICL